MNYVTHAVEFLKFAILPKLRGSIDAIPMFNFVSDIESSVKFLLPIKPHLGIKLSQAAINMLRLPYPCCTFEYEMPADTRWTHIKGYDGPIEASTKRLAIAWRVSPTEKMTDLANRLIRGSFIEGKTGVLFGSVFNHCDDVGEVWANAPALLFIETGSEAKFDENGEIMMYGNLVPYFIDTYRYMIRQHNGDRAQAELAILNDLSDETTVAIKMITCLNAKNIHEVTIDAPVKLNAKRAKKGKTPFYEYKTLDIFVNGDVVRTRNRNRVASALSLLRNSSKFHSVMGHFKHRKSGIFWWSDYVRGSKENGIVDKEYSINSNS